MGEVVASHPAVAECAVIGVHDQLKGQIPIGFVVLKADNDLDEEEVGKQLIRSVREVIRPVAVFKKVMVVNRLPKTRSGKILRKIMRHIADGEQYKAPSTIEDMGVLDELKQQLIKTMH